MTVPTFRSSHQQQRHESLSNAFHIQNAFLPFGRILIRAINVSTLLLIISGSVLAASESTRSTASHDTEYQQLLIHQHLKSTRRSLLRPRNLIVDEKTEAEQESLLNQINPMTYLLPHGHRANLSQYPYFAFWEGAYCGASLVAEDILLTAAHCGSSSNPLDTKLVRLQSSHYNNGGFQRVVVHQQVHPEYNGILRLYDFQLLKLDRTALFEDDGNNDTNATTPTGAQIVTLNDDYYNPQPNTDPVYLVGFGATVPEQGGMSDWLMDVELQAFSHQECEAQYGHKRIPDNIMFCCGVPGGGKDACQGDSGGPIVDEHGVQVAVISWGAGCAMADRYGVNARVSAVKAWIDRQVCQMSSHPPASCDRAAMTSVLHRPPKLHKAFGADTDFAATDSKNFRYQTPNIGTRGLQIVIQTDKYPEETSCDFVHMDSLTQLYWQPYQSIKVPYTIISKTFPELPPGTYQFRIGDTGGSLMDDGHTYTGDGISEFGNGSIAILTDSNNLLWSHDGNFTNFLQVTLELSKNGTVIWSKEETNYTSPSNEATLANTIAVENDPSNNDRDWPGVFPIRNEPNAMAVNVRYDDNSNEITWAFWYFKPIETNATSEKLKHSNSTDIKTRRQLSDDVADSKSETEMSASSDEDENASDDKRVTGKVGGSVDHLVPKNNLSIKSTKHEWTKLYQSSEADGQPNSLEFRYFYHMEPGLYSFILHDIKSDGMCCLGPVGRRGWMTLVSEQDVTWNHNGEFSDKVQAFVRLEENGAFHVVEQP